MSFLHLCQSLSVLSCGLFTGAAIFIHYVEHPSRMAVGTQYAASVFPGSYRRAAVMQAGLAILCFVSSMLACVAGAGIMWLFTGLLMFSVVPFTLIVMMPVNKKLLDPKVDKYSASTKSLLQTWGKLHGVRSVISFCALLLFLNQILPVVNK